MNDEGKLDPVDNKVSHRGGHFVHAPPRQQNCHFKFHRRAPPNLHLRLAWPVQFHMLFCIFAVY